MSPRFDKIPTKRNETSYPACKPSWVCTINPAPLFLIRSSICNEDNLKLKKGSCEH